MSPNGIPSGFDETFIFSSSDSSDSEFFFQEDIKNRESLINKQWEAIERTLYQEPGQKVTDPQLLKECKIWRETFPHFRVKGTKIDVKEGGKDLEGTEESVQTLENHFNLKIIEEKREKIKKEIVGALVERLIPKINQKRFMGWEKQESAKSDRNYKTGVEITEIDDETAEKMLNSSSDDLKSVENSDFPTPAGESYFERGKLTSGDTSNYEAMTGEQFEKHLFGLLDSWKEDNKTAIKLPETAVSSNSRKASTSPTGNLLIKNSHRSIVERQKPRQSIPRSDSLSAMVKPFEMTRKIDKKYEGLVERIMERQWNGFDARRLCRTSSSRLEKSYQESFANLKVEPEQNKRKNIPRINKFSNNWLDRNEANYHRSAGDYIFNDKIIKSNRSPKSFLLESMTQKESDERFIEELKKEMALSYKRPPKKSGVVEEINLRRPKPFSTTMPAKPCNSEDLSRKNKKEIKVGQCKRGLESGTRELNVKSRVKHNNSIGNKINKRKGNQNSLLPPIETGIICTELTGRPKIGPKNLSKRH